MTFLLIEQTWEVYFAAHLLATFGSSAYSFSFCPALLLYLYPLISTSRKVTKETWANQSISPAPIFCFSHSNSLDLILSPNTKCQQQHNNGDTELNRCRSGSKSRAIFVPSPYQGPFLLIQVHVINSFICSDLIITLNFSCLPLISGQKNQLFQIN